MSHEYKEVFARSIKAWQNCKNIAVMGLPADIEGEIQVGKDKPVFIFFAVLCKFLIDPPSDCSDTVVFRDCIRTGIPVVIAVNFYEIRDQGIF